MDTDLFLTIGSLLLLLTIPSWLSAWTEGRAPRFAALISLAAAGLIVVALTQKPGGYSFAELPELFLNVIGRFVN